jgi:hypothetical protein
MSFGPSVWDLMNSPEGQAAAKRGMAALQSGEVTPEEAHANLHPIMKALGYGKGGGKTSPLAMGSVGAGMSLPDVSVSPVSRGSGLMNEKEATAEEKAVDTTANKNVTQVNQYMPPSQLNDLYTSTARLPAFQQQQEGLEKERDLLGIASKAPSDVFSGPISGLLETEFGRKTGTLAANAGPSPMQQRKTLLDMTGKYQDDQRDLSKNIFDAIGKQRSGSTVQSLADTVALSNLLRDMNKDSAVDPRKFEKGGGKGYDPTKDVKELGKSLAPMAPTLNTLNKLDQLIGGIDNWKGQNIPGAGFMGRMAPSFMLSDKASQVQQTYRELQEELLKLYNGARITPPEYQRLSQALGANATGGDREFVNGLKRFRDEFKDVMAQKEAPFRGTHPEVIQLYKKGGGNTSDTVFANSPKAPPSTGPKRTKELKDMTDAELAAYEKQLTKGK